MFRHLWKVDICSGLLRLKLKATKDSKQGINLVFVNQGRVGYHHLTQHCSSSTGSYLYGVDRKHHPVHLHLSHHHHFHQHLPLPHHLHPRSISPSSSFLPSTRFNRLVQKELPSLHAISKHHQQPFHTLSQYSLSTSTATSQNRILCRLVLKELSSLHAISKHHQQPFHTLSQYSISTSTATSKNRLFLSLTQLNQDPYKFSTSLIKKMSTKNKESRSKGKRKHSEDDKDASKSDEAKDEASPTKKQKTTVGKSEKPETEPASQKSDSPTKDETTQKKRQKTTVEKSEKSKTESNELKKSDSPTKDREKTTTVSKDDSKKDGSSEEEEFFSRVAARRTSICPSVAEFKFNKKRVRVLSKVKDCPDDSQGLVYWMSRDQRVQDNWAFLYTQRLALKMEVPFHVCFCLVPKFLEATIRQFSFMLKGLEEVEEECRELKIPFHLLVGYAKDVLPEFVTKNSIGGVVTDFSPLRVPMGWVEDVKNSLPKDVTFCQVDAHNLVPCWEASPKQEYGARTIRNKIHNQLSNYLTEFPPVVRHKYRPKTMPEKVDWQAAEESLEVNRNIRLPEWCQPGTKGGLLTLKSFLNERLKYFGSDRNNPNRNALSNLSPWIHFGQISVQRSILMVMEKKSKHKEGADAFIEEAIIRRELADNFCYYNKKYDKIEGAYDWAKESLKLHWDDKRDYIYTREQLEESKTHDDLWNAAQYQMVTEGKMHGFLRMYWAKKILEWTPNPDVALQEAIYLNDKYQLDGRDPNGYVGCMWSICGIHDQGWKERTIFGKIRYMNYDGCKRKFDVPAFVRKYRIKKPLPGKK